MPKKKIQKKSGAGKKVKSKSSLSKELEKGENISPVVKLKKKKSKITIPVQTPEYKKQTRLETIKRQSGVDKKGDTDKDDEYQTIKISSILKYTPTYLEKITNPKEKRVINKMYSYLTKMDDIVQENEKSIIDNKSRREIINDQIKTVKDDIKIIESFIEEVNQRRTFFGYAKKKKELNNFNKNLNEKKKTLVQLESESKNLKNKIEDSKAVIKKIVTQTLNTNIN